MTGRRKPASTWLHNSALAAMWAVSEVTWICLWIRVAVANSPEFDMRLPLAVMAISAGGIAAFTGWATQSDRSWWNRLVLLIPMMLIVTPATAGAIAEGPTAGHATATSWIVAVLLVIRGTWVGWGEAGFKHVVWSAVTGILSYVVILLSQTGGDPEFNRATQGAGVLFVTWISLALMTMAMVYQRGRSREVLRRPILLPGRIWLRVLTGPLVTVVAVSSLVALTFDLGAMASPMWRTAAGGTEAVSSGISDAASAVSDFFSNDPSAPAPDQEMSNDGGGRKTRSGPPLTFPSFVIISLAIGSFAIGSSMLVKVLVSYARPGGLLSGPRLPDPETIDDQSRSVFDVRRFMAWLFDSLTGRLFNRRTQGSAPLCDPTSLRPPVRREYGEMLQAASLLGIPRRSSETPLEFEGRLGDHLDHDGARALGGLTYLYSAVRYGEQSVTDEGKEHLAARHAAERVIQQLRHRHRRRDGAAEIR